MKRLTVQIPANIGDPDPADPYALTDERAAYFEAEAAKAVDSAPVLFEADNVSAVLSVWRDAEARDTADQTGLQATYWAEDAAPVIQWLHGYADGPLTVGLAS